MTEKPLRRVRWKLMFGFAGFWGVVTLYAYAYFLWSASIALGAALFGSGFFIDRKHKRLEGKVADDSENSSAMPKGEIVAGESETLVLPAPPKQPSAPGGMK